jgi:protein-disulfide isomerase
MDIRNFRTGGIPLAAALFAGALAGACDQMPAGGPEKAMAPTPTPTQAPTPTPAAAPAPGAEKRIRPPGEAPELFKVPLGDSPSRGGRSPKVTIVAFSEFQCPFCARVLPTLDELTKSYGEDLRVVFKHRPLPFHGRAVPAALAAEAAGEQGKFWEMHDRLFASQKELDDASLEKHAADLGLDVARWKAALANGKARARVDADAKLADQLSVNGTPSFFINGRPLLGAQPADRFKAMVDEELIKADQKLAAGTARGALYAELTRAGLEKREEPAGRIGPAGNCQGGACPGAGVRAPVEDDGKIHKVELGNAPVRGPRDGAVTVVLFSEFQCPFCKKIAPTLEELEKAFPGKVRVAWKNFPLGFHEHARGAALAAHAAGQQGKFWQMHDKLLENQQALLPADLERYAQELGLDVARWKVAMASSELASLVDADMKQGQSLGVTGTPSMFINGRKVVGALPLDMLKPIVQEVLTPKPAGR